MTVSLATMQARLRHWALEHRMQRRFDRCCHGGEIGFRLSLGVRLAAANRFSRDPKQTARIIP